MVPPPLVQDAHRIEMRGDSVPMSRAKQNAQLFGKWKEVIYRQLLHPVPDWRRFHR
jgi:hypothetical protein